MDVLETKHVDKRVVDVVCNVRSISQFQNVPLEMSVMSAYTRQRCWPAVPPHSTSTTRPHKSAASTGTQPHTVFCGSELE